MLSGRMPVWCTPLQVEISHLGRVLGMGALLIAALVVGTILLISNIQSVADVLTVLLLGVSLAVAAVPESLPAILSVVLAMGVRRMVRHHAIVKKLASVETLGSASVIATDKTGTLTRGEMTVQRVMTACGRVDITGVGYTPEGQVQHDGALLARGPLCDGTLAVLRAGSTACNAQLQQNEQGAWCMVHTGRPDRGRLVGGRAQAGQAVPARPRHHTQPQPQPQHSATLGNATARCRAVLRAPW